MALPLLPLKPLWKSELASQWVTDKTEKRSAFAERLSISLRSGYFAGAQATGANRHGGGGPVNDSLYLADIGLPRTVGLAMGVRNVLTEHNALAANTALCHIDTSSHPVGAYHLSV